MNIAHAVSSDISRRNRKKPTHSEFMNFVTSKTSLSVDKVIADFSYVNKMPGRLTFPEYVLNGLYETSRYSDSERAQFVTRRLHWPIIRRVCDTSWEAVLEDKWLCKSFLERAGINTPKTLAVIDKSSRRYPGTPKIKDVSGLKVFLKSTEGSRFFGKPIRGISGIGSFCCEGFDGEVISLGSRGIMRLEDFLDNFIGDTPYIIEPVIENHDFFSGLTDRLSTLRVICFLYDDMLQVAYAVLKIPASGNITDSPLEEGNVVCLVDKESNGEIRSIVTSNDFERTYFNFHPESGRNIMNQCIPHWQDILRIVAATVPIFGPARYQSLDIALTESGPVVMETNMGGSFGMIQRAMAKGFLQDHFLHFLQQFNLDISDLSSELPVDTIEIRC